MSIQNYSKLVMVNGNTGTGNLSYAEYLLRLAVRRQSNGKVTSKDISFGVTGVAAGLDAAAEVFAQRISALSDGVIVNFFRKIGKYRNDELPKAVHDLRKSWASIIISNDPRSDDPMAVGPYPLKSVTGKIFVPWLDDKTSRQDMRETLIAPVTVGSDAYHFASSRFDDVQKTAVNVYPMQHVAGVMVKEYNKTVNFDLVNNDLGNDDAIISEKFTPIVSAGDDQV